MLMDASNCDDPLYPTNMRSKKKYAGSVIGSLNTGYPGATDAACHNNLMQKSTDSTGLKTDIHITLKNHCTRKMQSSRVGCSQRGHIYTVMVYLAVKEGNVYLNILILKVFFIDCCHLYIQLYICLTRVMWVKR